jgi:hypothetical protein
MAVLVRLGELWRGQDRRGAGGSRGKAKYVAERSGMSRRGVAVMVRWVAAGTGWLGSRGGSNIGTVRYGSRGSVRYVEVVKVGMGVERQSWLGAYW